MALALYRKYRPRSFAEIIGQEHVTEPLSQALRSGRLHHAYLFSGPRGCGKTSSARILARSLNCIKGPTPEPCGECDSCVALAPDGPGSIDVIEIDAASHGGVDDARDLRERAFFAPVASRYKVYVIDEAHMVSPAGFNALLKLVEEPPDYVTFVFATTEPEKVLGTIKSRTHHYPFRLIPPGVLRPYLEELCASEHVTVEPAVYPLVVRAGGGSVRDALSVMDQLISGAGPEGVTYGRALALLGVTDVALIDEMCDSLAAGDGASAYATIDRVVEAGHDPRRFAGDLLERLRDLIVLQQVPDAAGKGLLGAADDELERMVGQAERFGPATLSRMADIVHTGLTDMRGTTAPRLVLELIIARMLLPAADDSEGAMLQRLERMERRLTLSGGQASPAVAGPAPETSGVRTPPAPAVQEAPVTADESRARSTGSTRKTSPSPTTSSNDAPARSAAPSSATTPGAIDAAAVRRIWDEVLTIVRRKSPRAAAVVREASVREVDGDVLVLSFKHQFHAQALATAPEALLDAVYEVLGGAWQIRCEVAGQAGAIAPSGSTGPATTAAPAAASAATATQPSATNPTSGRGGRQSRGARQPADTSTSEDASAPATAPPSGQPTDADDDWPTPASLGGVAGPDSADDAHNATAAVQRRGPDAGMTAAGPSVGVVSTTDRVVPRPMQGDAAASGATTAVPTATETAAKSTAPEPKPPTPESSARHGATAAPAQRGDQARAAARRAASGGVGRSGARSAATSTGQNGSRANERRDSASDDAWTDGAADEPPYDPEFDGPARGGGYVGFDPGDEAVDDADPNAARQSSEEQALELLRQTLGAEKIGEIDTR